MLTRPVRWIRRALLALLAAVLPTAAHAQQLVTGRVTDAETGQPIIGARVVLLDSEVSVVSDFNGRYFLPVPSDFDRHWAPQINVLSIGYERQYGSAETVSRTDFLVRRLDLRLGRYAPPISCGRVALYTEPRVVFPNNLSAGSTHQSRSGFQPRHWHSSLAVISGGAVSGLLLALGVLEKEEEQRLQRRVSGS